MSEDVAATDNFENSVRIHPSIAQVRTIVEFMKKHPDLAQRKNGLGTQKFKKLWLHLSNTINAMDGAFKSTKGWIKYWNDKRKSVILKNRQILQGKLADTLSPLDKHILEVCDGSTFVMKKTKAVKQEPCNGDDFNNDDPSDEPIRSDEDDWELSRLKNKRLHSDTEERYTTLMEKLVPNTSTPRAIFPSREQQETLLDFLEERQWLAMAYFRTSHARDRAKNAWQQIATELNSDGRGAVKTWQQWAKYWKDKKSAVKRKTSQINLARQQTGGGATDCMELSTTEERILALMGGEQFAHGDAQLRVHPSHQETFGSPGSEQAQPPPPQELEVIHSNIQDPLATDNAASDMPVTPENYTPAPGPSTARITGPAPPASHNSSSNYRRRRVLPRLRRRLHSGPSQRHNLLRSFLDRVTAMEERRLDMEQRQTENQEELNGILRTISEAWTQQNHSPTYEPAKHVANVLQPLASTSTRDSRHSIFKEHSSKVDAMDQQATAMGHIAEASLGNAKALEQVAAASHMQALAIERMANTFDGVSSAAQDLRNAIMSIDYTMKRFYSAPNTERHNSNFFT